MDEADEGIPDISANKESGNTQALTHSMWVYTQMKPSSPVPRQISDDIGVLDDVGATDSRLRHVGLWMPRRFAESGQDWERGVTVCLEDSCPHLDANVLSGGTTIFLGIGERTTKELTSLAPPFSHQQSRCTQCDLWMYPFLTCTS